MHATSAITTHDPVTGAETGRIRLPGVGSAGGLMGRPEGGDEAWFGYTDFATPFRLLHLDGLTREVSVWATPPAEVAVPEINTQQVPFTSADGTTVRMFVLARADAVGPDGLPLAAAPTILNGYGGFGHTMTPGYSASMLAWVEAGGIYAVVGLRGGNEEGEAWHRDGMLANKQHVFDDFHAAATTLIDGGWTTPDRLGIQGGSNGGLLVGAALTQWPQLFAGVVCSAPLLDMVRYRVVRPRRLVDRRVRRCGRPGATGLVAGVLPLSPRGAADPLSRRSVHRVRGRYPSRSLACLQALRGAATCHERRAGRRTDIATPRGGGWPRGARSVEVRGAVGRLFGLPGALHRSADLAWMI